MSDRVKRDEAKEWWLRCISCSEAAYTQQSRSLGLENPDREQSVGLFSGGFLHRGHVCGLLQGAVLAAGSRSAEQIPDDAGLATAAALNAAIELVEKYPETSGSNECRDITQTDLTTFRGRIDYMRTGKAKLCGRLSLAWVERGPAIADEVIERCRQERPATGRSCVDEAVEAIPGLGPTDAVHLAGYAGGVGLSGNVCAVLAIGVFAMSAQKYEGRGPAKRDSQRTSAVHEMGFPVGLRKRANAFRQAFEERFGGILCAGVCGRRFDGPEDHYHFIEQGGCAEVAAFAASWLVDHP